MGQQQGAEAQHQPFRQLERVSSEGQLQSVEPLGEGPPALEEGHEEQAQGHAGDDVGVHHGDIVHRQQGVPLPPAQAVQPDGGEGARRRGDGGGQEGDQQSGVDALHDQPVLEQFPIPMEGEALPHSAGIPCVEGEDHQQEDGGV